MIFPGYVVICVVDKGCVPAAPALPPVTAGRITAGITILLPVPPLMAPGIAAAGKDPIHWHDALTEPSDCLYILRVGTSQRVDLTRVKIRRLVDQNIVPIVVIQTSLIDYTLLRKLTML